MAMSLSDFIQHETKREGVRALFVENPHSVLLSLDQGYPGFVVPEQVLVCELSKADFSRDVLETLADQLAQLALDLWPYWYLQQSSLCRVEGVAAKDLTRSLSAHWFEKAKLACERGRVPRIKSLLVSQEIKQLVNALSSASSVLLLSVHSQSPVHEINLSMLIPSVERIAERISQAVILLLPLSLKAHPALERIVSTSIQLDGDKVKEPTNSFASAHTPLSSSGITNTAEQQAFETSMAMDSSRSRPETTCNTFVTPQQGQPNAASRGELKLAELLAKDKELDKIFHFNQTISTVRCTQHIVDLLWEQGRLVVEVDGYRWHSSREKFRADRHRDYELMLTGYRVLRLSDAEIQEDALLALEKIRDMVRLVNRSKLA